MELADRFSKLEGNRVTMNGKEWRDRERIKRIEGGTGKNKEKFFRVVTDENHFITSSPHLSPTVVKSILFLSSMDTNFIC